LIYLKQIFLQNKPYQQILLKIKEYCGKWQNLTSLNISNNQLTSLPSEIAKLKNLTILDINNNQLTSLPLEISELIHLTRFDVSNNQLTSLPPEISGLYLDITWKCQLGIRGMFLEGNPLENLPIEIIKRGLESVRIYFKSLEDRNKPLNEVKVLLVGEGSAGKTSLVKKIFEKEVDGNEPQT
jgi:internalin A